LAAAGVVAGTIGAAGGITSLVSYSALLAVGVPPLPATVSNLVASVACWPGSALTSRRELAGTRYLLFRVLPIAAIAAGVGSMLLLSTPAGVFSRVVPFLIALASLTLLSQPWLTAGAAHNASQTRPLAWLLVTLVSIYAGYFGAGSGIMLLAILLVLFDDRLPEANAIKNMLVGVTSLAAAVIFVCAHPVDWAVVAPLAIGLFGGSMIGPVVARRLPARIVRWAVAALGLALATELWLNPV
jgi:uncharacterized protein